MGYTELFNITINSLNAVVEQLHFDLFTVQGNLPLDNTSMVEAFAPFSHNAETGVIPEPGVVGPSGMALLGLLARARRRF